jgi:putative DNA primase/helicase
MPNTYLGREDLGLLDRLKSEMSGILNWAIVGRHRLNEERKITQPAAGRKLIQELEELTSPVSLFIEEWCEFGSSQENDFSVETKHLFSKWEQYCNENDVEHPGSVQSFSRKIKAIRPEVTISQFRKSTTERGRKMLGIRLLDNPRSEKASPEPKF